MTVDLEKLRRGVNMLFDLKNERSLHTCPGQTIRCRGRLYKFQSTSVPAQTSRSMAQPHGSTYALAPPSPIKIAVKNSARVPHFCVSRHHVKFSSGSYQRGRGKGTPGSRCMRRASPLTICLFPIKSFVCVASTYNCWQTISPLTNKVIQKKHSPF
ncbi:hypothetical protein BD289DRAFT_276957 [Coniella lustricola]|uniref:Uncharacterized protein n=1 Tax=Coniella lustricola TaxID=2025994 RepID=A0A2T3A6H4_9PEZI|nr:hypothetical protein BD289DRAFT_276957 [Coniella lustricola]